jgi:hypothetical protein
VVCVARRARRASATGEQVDDHPRFLRALARLCITPVFTATDASWMNLTEAQFGVLQRFTLTDTDDPSHGVRQRRIRHFLRHRHHQPATDRSPAHACTCLLIKLGALR